jgi:signal transduction histidine kinase/DNA-binding NarL/FixJ family response regulator
MIQSDRLQALQLQLDNATTDKDRLNLMLDICAETRLYDIEKAETLARQALQLSSDIDYKLGIGRSLYALGSSLWQKGDYQESVRVLTEAGEVAKNIRDLKLDGKSSNMLGNVHRDMGELSQALGYYINAQDYFDKLGDRDTIGVVLMNLALTFFALGEYDSALDNALKSVAILEGQGSEFRLFSIYHALGDIYFKQNDLSNALTYFYKSLELTQTDTSPHALALSGIGKVHLLQGDMPKAYNYLSKSKALSESNHFIESTIVSSFYLGRWYMQQHELEKSLVEYNTALDSAVQHGRRHDEMSVHEFLAQNYEALGETQSAYDHLKRYEQLRGEIFALESINQMRNRKVLSDISTARKEREVAVRTAAVKQQFLANMSHEIRTPMNAVIGMTRLLLEKNYLPHQERYLKAIKASADNLLVIINDILDISKLEAGKFQIEQIPLSIRAAVAGVFHMLRIKAQEKNLEFSYEVEQAIPDVLIGDPTRISQVLLNLVSNAIKFTDAGSVKILVRAKHRNEREILLKIEVIDTGVGVDDSYVHQLFEKFTQAGSDTARKYGGTGLGLSISRQLVSLMGGDIWAKGQQGVGSTFTIELPLLISETQMLSEAAVEELTNKEISSLAGKKILLVEDNEFNQMLAIDTLMDLSPTIKIDVALNGKIAVEKATATLYDVILMDIQMPVMTGVQATELIRSTLRPPFCDVPIIAMTANVMKEDIDQYLASGMNSYVSKPFTPHVLVHNMVQFFGDEAHGDLQIASEHTIPPLQAKEPAFTNLNFLQGLTKGDVQKQHKYLEIFLRTAPPLLAEAQSSLMKKDRARLRVNVHSLKGQLAYMGVQENSSGVFAFEKACTDEIEDWVALEARMKLLQATCIATFAEVKEAAEGLVR